MSDVKPSPLGCPLCCYSCFQCCCPSDKASDKYPNIQYKTPAQANIAVGSPQFAKVPLSKMFDFHQPKTEYGVHPQITSDTESTEVVSDQPKHISRPTSLEYGPSLDEQSSATSTPADTLPTLQYSIYYDLQRSTLTVSLEQAYNLPSKAQGGKCDSYVVIYLLPNKREMFESRVARRSLNPIYDQVFVFSSLPGVQSIRKQTLMFKVFEHSRFSSRELVGVVSVPLENADIYGVTVKSRIEQKDSGGEVESLGDILFSLTYRPQSHTLHGILLKATSLKRQDIGGSADPYVKIHVYHKERRVHKWKSQVKKNTLVPVFNEPFQFDIFNMDIEDISLELIVMDYDRFSRDDLVGEVNIGLNAADEMGRTHWEEVIATPEQAISRWHPIAPPTFERSSSVGSSRSHTL